MLNPMMGRGYQGYMQANQSVVEEEDEETKEWEQEQLRRGGLRAESIEPVAKPVYKPAPSTLISHLVESWY